MRRLLLVLTVGISLGGRAWAIDDVLTPRGIAMGGAGRAAAMGALGPLLNPAGLTLMHQYTLEGMYGFRVQDLGSTVHLSVADSATNPRLAMGLYYTYVHSSPRFLYPDAAAHTDAARSGHETGLSLAIPFGDRFSFGLTSKYTTVSTEVANPDADKAGQPKTIVLDSTTKQATADGFTIDLGLALRLGDSFNVGVVGYNLIPLHSIESPIAMGIGLSYLAAGTLLIAADLKIDFDKYYDKNGVKPDGTVIPGDRLTTVRFGAGAEYVAGNAVPIRIGLAHDTGVPGGTYLSAGVGYQAKSFGIDLAWRNKVNRGNETFLLVGIRVFLE